MPKTTVRLLFNRFPELARKLPDAALAIAEETVKAIDDTIQTGMAASSSPSAPGQFPAIVTGALAGSLHYTIARGTYTIRYYSESFYAPMLEYGTSRMLARPFLTPAAERNRQLFLRKMKRLEDRLR